MVSYDPGVPRVLVSLVDGLTRIAKKRQALTQGGNRDRRMIKNNGSTETKRMNQQSIGQIDPVSECNESP